MGGSMSSVVISGDTSGAITLAAPAVSGTNTATLPAATGTVMVSGNMPTFSAILGSNQTLSNQVWTKVQINTKEWDTANCFDATTNYRFTPTVAGYYSIVGIVRSNATIGMYKVITGIWKNGAEYARPAEPCYFTTTMGNTVQFGGSTLVYLNGSTDYVELYAYIYGSGTLSVLNDGNRAYNCSFQGSLVRTA